MVSCSLFLCLYNGIGMYSEHLEEMLLSNFQNEGGEYLGLYNITKRLEIFYQDKVDIFYSIRRV